MPSQDMTRDEIEKYRDKDITPIETYCYMRALRGEGPGRAVTLAAFTDPSIKAAVERGTRSGVEMRSKPLLGAT